MKRVGEASGRILLSVDPVEFQALTGVTEASSNDGDEYDVSRLTTLRSLLETKRAALVAVRSQCLALAQAIADMA
jgi:hypothetical protein